MKVKMKVEITEEEREFLERVCIRAEIFARKGLGQRRMEKDLEAIRNLIRKFREAGISDEKFDEILK